MTRIGMALDPASERARIARLRRRERLRPWLEGFIAFLAVTIMATGIWVQFTNTSTAVDGDALLAEFADEFDEPADGTATDVAPSDPAPPGQTAIAAGQAPTDDQGDVGTGQSTDDGSMADEAEPTAPAPASSDAPGSDASGSDPAGSAEPDPSEQQPAGEQGQEPPPASGPAAEPTFALPAEGVYTYATTGYESISIAGARHDYPEETYIVVRHEGGCTVTLDHRILEEKRSKNTVCYEGPTIEKVRHDSEITFFGQTEESHYTCQGVNADLRDDIGATHTGSCTDDNRDAETVDTLTFVGVETMNIGGVDVQAHHYRQVSEVRGDIQGGGEADFWYRPSDGLILRIERRNDTRANAFGGDVDYHEEATFQLVSLEPRR